MSQIEANQLLGVELDFISLVDKGAHQDAHVVLYKRDGDDAEAVSKGKKKAKQTESCSECGAELDAEGVCPDCDGDDVEKYADSRLTKVLKRIGAILGSGAPSADDSGTLVSMETVTKVGRKASAKRIKALREMRDQLDNVLSEIDDNDGGTAMPAGVTKVEAKPGEVVGEDLIKYLGTLEELVIKADDAGAFDPDDEDDDNDDDVVVKSLSPELQAILKSANERAENAEKLAKSATDQLLHTEMLNKADTMRALPGFDREATAEILKGLAASLTPAQYEATVASMVGASEAIRQSGAFVEIGKNDSGTEGSAIEKITKMAEEAVAADTTGALTIAAAITKIASTNPDLYREYKSEAL